MAPALGEQQEAAVDGGVAQRERVAVNADREVSARRDQALASAQAFEERLQKQLKTGGLLSLNLKQFPTLLRG